MVTAEEDSKTGNLWACLKVFEISESEYNSWFEAGGNLFLCIFMHGRSIYWAQYESGIFWGLKKHPVFLSVSAIVLGA